VELTRSRDEAERELMAAAARTAELVEALEASSDGAMTLRQQLAQAQAGGAAAAAARKALTRAQTQVQTLEAEKDALEAKLIEAAADIRAANTAATSAHMRASAAAAAAAAVRGAADDPDDCDEGETVPAAKARRLETALDAANQQLRVLMESRDRQRDAVASEFAAQYELRQKAEETLLAQLADKETALTAATTLTATLENELVALRAEVGAARAEAGSALSERGAAELRRATERAAAAVAARDELDALLQAQLQLLVTAKMESAELHGRVLELRNEAASARAKQAKLAAKCTQLEVAHYNAQAAQSAAAAAEVAAATAPAA
jgi:hypothetical protein